MVSLLPEVCPRSRELIGHLGRYTCRACCGQGYEVIEYLDPIERARVDFTQGMLSLESPVERGERFVIDATAMMVEGARPERGGVALFRVRWVYRACAHCRGRRWVSREYLAKLGDQLWDRIIATSEGSLRYATALLLTLFIGCASPAPRAPWHLQLEGGVVTVAEGEQLSEASVRLPAARSPRRSTWTGYDLAAWRELLARTWAGRGRR